MATTQKTGLEMLRGTARGLCMDAEVYRIGRQYHLVLPQYIQQGDGFTFFKKIVHLGPDADAADTTIVRYFREGR